MKIDNFALNMFQTCPAKFDLRMNQGWTPSRKSGALGFGGAIHEGLAEWYRTGNAIKALQAIDKAWPDNMPVDDYRNKQKCLEVMKEYMKQYPSENWKIVQGPSGPLIEVPFTLDTGMFLPCGLSWQSPADSDKRQDACPGYMEPADEDGKCPNCNNLCESIEYGGIFDGVIEFSGTLYALEHKSTSMLGPMYFNQFRPNNQVTGYVWAAGEMSGLPVGGALINAIGVYKTGATKFARQLTGRYPEEIAEWKKNVYMVCCQIATARLTGQWSKSTGACTLYGLCEFHSVHSLGREAERQKLLEQQYIVEHWDYEKRGGTEVPNGNG